MVANYLKGVFEAAGIPVKTFALQPARANLVARIKGNGSKRPVLIMAHIDVVGVQREKWPVGGAHCEAAGTEAAGDRVQ